jgi:hypothetical protein
MSSSDHTRRRWASIRRIATATALLASVVALATASPALAGKPTGGFAVFADCPLSTPGVNQCVYATFTGGSLTLGNTATPIKNPITLQGGLVVSEPSETFVGVTEGQTLSKTAEEVPGGLTGIPGHESSSLTITLELVGSVALSRGHLFAGEGVALTLPVRAHLKNIYLGEECVIGSSSKPITLNLTTGVTSPPPPNKPITGSPGKHESLESGNLVINKGDSLVGNDFSVPGAEGCGPVSQRSLFNSIVNQKFGLPAAAGHNTAILQGTSEFANAEAVLKSE